MSAGQTIAVAALGICLGAGVVPGASPANGPETPAVDGGIGSGVGADALSNTQVGGPNGSRDRVVAMRFRAEHGGALASVRPYVIWSRDRPGCSAGIGGRLRFTVQTDDGSPRHLPSAKVLASASFRHPVGRSHFPRLKFQPRPRLAAGELYHVVVSTRRRARDRTSRRSMRCGCSEGSSRSSTRLTGVPVPRRPVAPTPRPHPDPGAGLR